MNLERYLARLLKHPSGLRAGGISRGVEIVASYVDDAGARPFAFCRHGLMIDPDGEGRFIAFADIQDTGSHDAEALSASKDHRRSGEPMQETLTLGLQGGERIVLPLNVRTDGFSERLTIATLIDRSVRREKAFGDTEQFGLRSFGDQPRH